MSPAKQFARKRPGNRGAGTVKGRPRRYGENWTKVTVVLFDRQIQMLDGLIADARAARGRVFSRAEIIRDLVDVLAASRVQLRDLGVKERLMQRLTSRLSD